MKVKLENTCFLGEGNDRKRYEAGSVVEVEADVAELNPWMKPTDEPLKEAPAAKPVKVDGE